MAKRNQKEIVTVDEIPPDVIGAVVAADLCQIEADAKTQQDKDARRRILFCVDRLRQIAQAEITPELVKVISEVQAIFEKGEGTTK